MISFDHVIGCIEIALLVWIVWQGELIRYYERELWRINVDRYQERKQWRLAKQRKTTQKTSDSVESTEPPSKKKEPGVSNKDNSALFV